MPRSFVEQALARCSVEGSKFWFNCNPEHPQHWFLPRVDQTGGAQKRAVPPFPHGGTILPFSGAAGAVPQPLLGNLLQAFCGGEWTAPEGLVYPFMTDPPAFRRRPRRPWSGTPSRAITARSIPAPWDCGGKKEGGVVPAARILPRFPRRRRAADRRGALCRPVQALGEITPECIVVDPSAASFLELIRRKGRCRAVPARNSVVDGIRETSAALKAGSIVICGNCRDAIREFSLYRWETASAKDQPKRSTTTRWTTSAILSPRCFMRTRSPFFALAAGRGGQARW